MDYSYYLKNKNKNDKEQIKEIINITRILLVALSESSTWEADILIKTCFEFMFLFKNKEIANNDKEKEENENFQYFKILEIRKNEHFGDVLMFLHQRSFLRLRVKTKKAELFFLNKEYAINISTSYPQYWKTINKK